MPKPSPHYRAHAALRKDLVNVVTMQRELYSAEEYAELLTTFTGRPFSKETVEAIGENPLKFLGADFADYMRGLGFVIRVDNFEIDGLLKIPEKFNVEKPTRSLKQLERNLVLFQTICDRGLTVVELHGAGTEQLWLYPDEQAKEEYANVTQRLIERQIEERRKLSDTMKNEPT